MDKNECFTRKLPNDTVCERLEVKYVTGSQSK